MSLNQQDFLTVSEVALMKGWHEETVRRKCRSGELKAQKTTTENGGTLWLINKTALDDDASYAVDVLPINKAIDLDTLNKLLNNAIMHALDQVTLKHQKQVDDLKNVIKKQEQVMYGLNQVIEDKSMQINQLNNQLINAQKREEEFVRKEEDLYECISKLVTNAIDQQEKQTSCESELLTRVAVIEDKISSEQTSFWSKLLKKK